MDSNLYKAAASGDAEYFEGFNEANSAVLLQETMQRNTILHVAVNFKQKNVAEKIIDLQPSLVSKKNSRDDTPLHIAARLGCLDIVTILVSSTKATSREVEAQEKVVKMVNEDQDTALHDAVRNGHFEVVKYLINKDLDLANLVNKAGESPLFLAVDRAFFKIANLILEKTTMDSPYRGRDNMNVLHAAVVRTELHLVNNYAEKISQLLRKFSGCKHLDFIGKLLDKYPSAAQETDDYGRTPLHYAAHLGNWKAVEFFLTTDSSLAYMKDKEGMSALHLAAKKGHVQVMKTLNTICPDACELLDKEGRTALHVAAESGQVNSAKYLLKATNFDGLLNERDKKGNTALLQAAAKGNYAILNLLAKDSRVQKGTLSNKGWAAMDIIETNDDLDISEKLRILIALARGHGLPSLKQLVHSENTEMQNRDNKGQEQPEELAKKKEPAEEAGQEGHAAAETGIKDDKEKPSEAKKYTFNQLKDMAEINLLVATIIATVTFQAALTVPGGYSSGDGKALLIKKPAFIVFLVCDTLAFCSSTFAMSIHFWASLERHRRNLEGFIRSARSYAYFSVLMLLIAFISGTSAGLDHSLSLVPITIGCISCFRLLDLILLKIFV